MSKNVNIKSWKQSFKSYTKPTVLTMLFLGISSGTPILLIFSSLSLWLREAGVERSSVTFFSWAALGYSFKFIWAPLVDRLSIPWFTLNLGRRRSWLLLSQILIIIAIFWMALTDPAQSSQNINLLACAAVLLGFSAATQDISIDAYRIESDSVEMQAPLSASYIAGYRIGMIIAGAGALHLATLLGSTPENYSYSAWRWTYIIMGLVMLIGVITTLLMPEPKTIKLKKTNFSTRDYSRFFILFLVAVSGFISTFYFMNPVVVSIKEFLIAGVGQGLSSFIAESTKMISAILVAILVAKGILSLNFVNKEMVEETYIAPVKDFFNRYGTSVALLLLSLVGLYRISDIVLGVISNIFYQDLGFTKIEIANVVKTFGLIMALAGGFLGGLMTVRYGVMRILFLGAVLSAATNLLFMVLANVGNNMPLLYLVISADNLSAGLASAAFVAFLSSLTNISFTAVQYAIFTSLMTLFPKVLGGYSGSMVDALGYQTFFAITAIMGVPVLYIVWLANKKLKVKGPTKSPTNNL